MTFHRTNLGPQADLNFLRLVKIAKMFVRPSFLSKAVYYLIIQHDRDLPLYLILDKLIMNDWYIGNTMECHISQSNNVLKLTFDNNVLEYEIYVFDIV